MSFYVGRSIKRAMLYRELSAAMSGFYGLAKSERRSGQRCTSIDGHKLDSWCFETQNVDTFYLNRSLHAIIGTPKL